jgi:hypothetical protein
VRQTGRYRRSSIETRLLRLEAMRGSRASPSYRRATILIGESDAAGEQHLLLVGPADDPSCFFKQMPGPGPQLADFGKFDQMLCVTQAEMDA